MIIDLSHLVFMDKPKYRDKILAYLNKYAKFLYPDYDVSDSDVLDSLAGPTVFYALESISGALSKKYSKRGFLSAYKDFHAMSQELVEYKEANALIHFLRDLNKLYEDNVIEEEIKIITGTFTPPMVAMLLATLNNYAYMIRLPQITINFSHRLEDIVVVTNDTNFIVEQMDLRSKVVYARVDAIVKAIKFGIPGASKEQLENFYAKVTGKNIIPYYDYDELFQKLLTKELGISKEEFNKLIKRKEASGTWSSGLGFFRQFRTQIISADRNNISSSTEPTWTTFEGEIEVDLIREDM